VQFCANELAPQDNHIAFVGSMDWHPNEDAILHFVEAILPRLRDHRPEVSLTIVGRNPSLRLRSLAERDQRIIVTGQVPDVRPYISNAAATIVPLVIVTLSRALRERFDRHRAIARWTYPLWVYVSVTGVVIYFMLYHLFAA
jgi:hypothetical protein